jgi:DNA-binding HxlR family transcriptional regulator
MIEDLSYIVCPIQRAATLVGDVNVIVILRELQGGPKRFGHFVDVGLNPRSLSKRLQRLADEGILTRTAYAESPPRVEYQLTSKGRALTPVLRALQEFGETWLPTTPWDREAFKEESQKP